MNQQLPKVLAVFAVIACGPSNGMADEYRLYRIVGDELELYRRIEFEPVLSDETYVSNVPGLRAAGFYDVSAEDMADEARRPRSRGDGLLWDAPRSRWIGFASELSATLVAIDPNDEQTAEEVLHEFESVAEASYEFWPTSDADIYLATLTSYNGDWLPKVTRLQFAENGEIASLETWDIADSERKTSDTYLPTVSSRGQVYSVAANITKWDFGGPSPLRVLKQSGESNDYMQCAESPSGEIVAAVSGRDGCYLDLWNTTDEQPFQSMPLQEKGWLRGGGVAFTPDGEYLWYNSFFLGYLRVWRCSDWTELDAHQSAGFIGANFSSMHAAEWITVSRDVLFEEEPTDWFERGPYDPEQVEGWSEPDFSPEALLRGVVLGLLKELLSPSDSDRASRAERRRQRRQLPRRPTWDEQ